MTCVKYPIYKILAGEEDIKKGRLDEKDLEIDNKFSKLDECLILRQ